MKPSRFPANRNAKRAKKNTFSMEVDFSSLDDLISQIEGDVEKAVRPAAQAAAQVFYEAVLKNVHGLGSVTGSLAASIYQAYSKEQSTPLKAVYHISWRTSNSILSDTGQNINTGLATAPHGHLVEFGYIQRYANYVGKNGHWYTAVRPENYGKKLPRRATRAQKDAFYVPRPGGPRQVAAHPFIRPAIYKQGEAIAAAKLKFFEIVGTP